MATTESSAPPAHHVPEAVRERVLRGLDLYRVHGDAVEHMGHGKYSVPGCSGGSYTVDLVPFGGEESCSCPDYRRHKTPCKHIFSATIWRSKSRAASLRTQRPKFSPDVVAANLERLVV
jgi:hypothetical protein